MLPAGRGIDPGPALDALARQSRSPDAVAAVHHAAGFEDAIRTALDAGSEWIWLLDGSVVPELSALEQLLDALGRLRLLPAPVLLASKVVLPDGRLDPRSLPVAHVFDPDLVTEAFERHLVAVRVARRGSLLVNRRGFERWGLPRTGSVFFGDDLVWTARLLRDEPGLLVPASVATRQTRAGESDERWRRPAVSEGVRLILSDGLGWGEKPWFGGRLVEDFLAALPARRPTESAARPAGPA